jgi:carbonic anhydrase
VPKQQAWKQPPKHNVTDRLDAITRFKNASPLLTDALSKGTLKIVGGVYRLASGKVDLIA